MKHQTSWVLALLLGAILPVAAEAQLNEKWGVPGSPTGQAVAVVLEMIERGDEGYIREMVGERFHPDFASSHPMEAHVSIFMQLHERLPGLEPAGLMRTPVGARLRIVGTNGESVNLQIGLSDDGRIEGLQIGEGGGSGGDPDRPLEDRLEQWEAEDRFSGVVYRTVEGRPIWARAYGDANRADGVANTVDTRFNIASLTKAFTGASILLLREEGLLDLDDSIGEYLDGFPTEIASAVTIRHLLMHRSGWGHYWENEAFLSNRASLRTMSDYMEFIRDIPLDFEPGTERQYSNVGFEVLGAVIEAVTGGSYYDFVQARIFDALGMDDSGFFEVDRPTPRRAVGYTGNHPYVDAEGELMANVLLLGPKGTAAGGSYSTAADLARFWDAMFTYDLLSPEASHMVMGDYREGEGAPGGVNVYGGGAPGISALVVLKPHTPGIDIVLANMDTEVTSELARALEEEG